jgi:hypothetical protein
MDSSPSQQPDRLRQFLTVFAILGAFLINTLSNLYPLNGENVGEISNTRFADVLITPANYAFAIWGLIYLGLIGFAFYQFLAPAQQHSRLRPISYLLVIACIFQSLWIFAFLSRQFTLSVLAMLALLLCLIGIYLQMQKQPRITRAERWLLRVPFSVYLGWISVATVVNIALALFNVGWNGWGIAPTTWTVILLVISSTLPITLLFRYRDLAYALVFVWSFVAIAVRSNFSSITLTAMGLAILLALLTLAVALRWDERLLRS